MAGAGIDCTKTGILQRERNKGPHASTTPDQTKERNQDLLANKYEPGQRTFAATAFHCLMPRHLHFLTAPLYAPRMREPAGRTTDGPGGDGKSRNGDARGLR